jgi:hypothetical protein
MKVGPLVLDMDVYELRYPGRVIASIGLVELYCRLWMEELWIRDTPLLL